MSMLQPTFPERPLSASGGVEVIDLFSRRRAWQIPVVGVKSPSMSVFWCGAVVALFLVTKTSNGFFTKPGDSIVAFFLALFELL